MANYPASLDNGTTLPNPSAGSFTNNPTHSGLHGTENAAIIALETKLGTTSSSPSGTNLLISTGTGTSTWSKVAPTGTIVGTTDSQVLTNKTLTSPTINTPNITNATITTDLITGYTVPTTGTIYGISVAAGIINSAALVNTVNTAAIVTGIQLPDKMKNPYKFSVYRTAALNSNSTDTVIAFDTKLFDTGSNVDIVTNKGRFTAPVAGFYYFNAVAGNSAATSTLMRAGLFKNGALAKIGKQAVPSTANNLFTVSGLIQLAVNDYVEATFVGGGGSTMQVGANQCYFDGFLVSAT